MNFPKLYNLTKTGQVQEWEIKVTESPCKIVTIYGKKGGKMVTSEQFVTKGKNKGKANETTCLEQAIKVAESKFKKKSETYDTGTSLPNGTPKAMLVSDYEKHHTRVKFPCYVQPKLDGYRCIYNGKTGVFTTRQGKELTTVSEAVKTQLKKYGEIVLDGELYSHGDSFESLGALRKISGKSNVPFHIYDVLTDGPFEDRLSILETIACTKNVQVVKTIKIDNVKELDNLHAQFVSQGYEGTIVRNADGIYHQYRSLQIFKKKDFMDAEFPIVGFTCEKGTGKEIVWKLQLPNGTVVSVRPQGSKEERSDLFKRATNSFAEFEGRRVWVKFFEWTKSGNLRFPSTMRNSFDDYIRDEVI